MKKIITFITLALISMTALATNYTDQLTVYVNGAMATKQQTTITVEQQTNGKYTLSLKNFILKQNGQQMGIGNVVMNDVEGTTANGVTSLAASENVNITNGDDPSISTWVGSLMGPVPVNLMAEIRGEKLYAVIDIALESQTIKVIFGNGGYQVNNSDFESFHTATITSPDGTNKATSDEPDTWHSFMSASGNPTYSYLAGYNPHTFISSIVRPGSIGTKSVLLTSLDMMIAIANGTMTTGRINTGSITADDVANHAWMDMSSTDTDAKGDPFYSAMNGKPDSLTVWVKFKQGTFVSQHPYATVNAVITDGTYYQDPQDKTYNNILAKATNRQIESKNYTWQKLTFPFDYELYKTNNVSGKAILITISTNADAGKGSTDSLYVDDMSLIYNCKLNSLKIGGKDVSGFDKNILSYDIQSNGKISADDIVAVADGQGANVTKTLENTNGGVTAKVKVVSNDLTSSTTYILNIKGATTDGISTAATNIQTVKSVYNMNGQRVNTIDGKGMYIIRYSSGRTQKRIQK